MTLPPQELASRGSGTPQVVYTIASPHTGHPDDALLSESGAMNFFVLLEDAAGRLELVTPPLDGTILPGVTRDSILCLTREWGEFAVSERPISIREVAEVCVLFVVLLLVATPCGAGVEGWAVA